MPSSTSLKIRAILGILMLALGIFVLVRLYVLNLPPKLGSQSIDTIFGVFFILRGALSLRRSRRPPDAA